MTINNIGFNGINPTALYAQQKGVRTVFADYGKCVYQWTRCRDVIAGSDAVKYKGNLYLPQLKQQEIADYRAYLLRAFFYNATGRTVSAMNGMIFRKPPTMTVSDNVLNLLKNVNLSGDTFEVFIREVANEVISVGKIGVLVDCTPPIDTNGQPITIAVAQQLGIRPLMKTYTAENIFNWKYTTIGNETILSRVVLQEQAVQEIDEWTTKLVPNYRVLDLDENGQYRVRVFDIDDNNNDRLLETLQPLMNGKPLTFIPFMFICPDGTDADYDESPILDLVDVNLSHFRTSADYEHGCHFTALPMAVISGMSPFNDDGTSANVYIGSASALLLPNPEAKAVYLEFKGDGLKTLESNLDRKEAFMAVLGAKMLAPEKKAPETAFTTAMTKVGENSILASISIAVSLAMQKCLEWFSMWADPSYVTDSVEFDLNKDFLPVAIDGPTLTAYVQAYQAGTMTLEDLFDLFQRADLIEAEVQFDDWQTQIKKEKAENKPNPQLDPATGLPIHPALITKVPANPSLEKPPVKPATP